MASGNIPDQIMSNDPEGSEWITIRQMAERDDVTERTVNSRIKTGYYKSMLTEDGRRLLLWHRKQLQEDVNLLPESNFNASGNASRNIQEVGYEAYQEAFPEVVNLRIENAELKAKLAECTLLLSEARERTARLEGQMEGHQALLDERDRVIAALNETITAKDQAINAANAAVFLYEKQNQAALDAPLDASRQIESKPSGWKWPWQK